MSFDPLNWIDAELDSWDALGLRRHLAVRLSRPGSHIVWSGKSLVNFGSNDYLGLAGEPRSADESHSESALGRGSGASPLVSGRGVVHAELERALADFEQTESAVLFPTGYAANVGTIAALASKGDVILSDSKNHASIIDGCRLSGARVVVYPHRNLEYVEMMLQQASMFRRRMIVTDALFSMDGDLAPLPALVELADKYQAMLVVDEAHATGVFGQHGKGIAEFQGVADQIPVRIGTLSKALGVLGGFVAGEQRLIDWLVNRARTLIFSTAAPESLALATLASLACVRDEPHRRTTLLACAEEMRSGLLSLGFRVGDSQSQIIPVFVGDPDSAVTLSAELRERGYFVPAIRPPSVPEGESLLRISLTCQHDSACLQSFLDVMRELRSSIKWPMQGM